MKWYNVHLYSLFSKLYENFEELFLKWMVISDRKSPALKKPFLMQLRHFYPPARREKDIKKSGNPLFTGSHVAIL